MSARDLMTSFHSPFGPSFPGAYSPDAGDFVVKFRRGGGRYYGPGTPALSPATPYFYNPPAYYQGWGDGEGALFKSAFTAVLGSPVAKFFLAGGVLLLLGKRPVAGLALATMGGLLGWKACREQARLPGLFLEALDASPASDGEKLMVRAHMSANALDTNLQGYGGWGSGTFGRYGGVTTGDDVATSIESAKRGAPGIADTITALAPTISTVAEALTDPYKQVEILKWKIAKERNPTHRAKLEAKLRAAQARLGIKEESLDSTREWRSLGKAGGLTAIALGGALIFFILVKAMQGPRHARPASAAA